MDEAALKRICGLIETMADEAIEIEKQLTAIPALSPENDGDGESEKAAWLTSYLETTLRCRNIQRFDAPDNRTSSGVRPNIVARFPGESSERTIWIMSHIDVVPAGDPDKWHGDPWTTRVEDGKIFGRGTEDNQQGIVSSLLTAKAFVDAGIKPKYDVALLLVADEETGSHYGIQHVLRQSPDMFSANDFIIIPDAGNAEGTLVEVAEKSIIWFKFVVHGQQTHGSTPELGINAFKAGANLVVKLNRLYEIFDASDEVFDPPISTFEPTKKDANVPNVNTIPGEDVFYFDCRVLPRYTLTEVKKAVREICVEAEQELGVRIDISYDQDLEAPPPTPVDAPVVLAISQAIAEVKKVTPQAMGIGGGTVAAYFRQAGLPAVVWASQDESLHEPNEYAVVSNILDDAKVFAHVALQ